MGDIIEIGSGRGFPVAVGKTVRNHHVQNLQFTWHAFCQKLKTPKRTAETMLEYQEMSVDEQGAIKDVGYFVPGHFENEIRSKDYLHKRWFGCLDIDHAKPDWLDWIELSYSGFAYVIHSTHKHRPDNPRLRMIFPLSRSTNEIEYQALVRAIAHRWDMTVFDHTGFQFTRVMHFPSIPCDAEYVFIEQPGPFLDVNRVLAKYADYTDIASWPVTPKEHEAPRAGTKKAENPLEKPGIIGAFCRTYGIDEAIEAFLPDEYTPGSTPNRYTYSRGSGANGAVVYDNLFLYSHHETDPCGQKNVNAFDLVRLHLFGHLDKHAEPDTKPTELRSYKKMMHFAHEDAAVANLYVQEHHDLVREEMDFDDDDLGLDPPEPRTKPKKKKVPSREASQKAIKAWEFRTDPTTRQVIKSSLHNVIGFLETRPKLQGCIQENQFTGTLMQMHAIPGLKGKIPEGGIPWSDRAEVAIKAYIEREHKICFSTILIHEACIRVGNRHAFNPPLEWLRGLEWDGVDRLATFFVDYLGAPNSPYVRAVTVKWFCQAVARLLRPGCIADHMLVIEGPEGTLKSTLFRILSKTWFTDNVSLGLDTKEIVERTRGAWIVEVQEMITRSNANNEHVKAFITRRSENVRLSYERNAGEYPRHFVLAGTTNENDYLKGATGNRRMWPIQGDGRPIAVHKIEKLVDQLWAEAKFMFCTLGEPLYLEDRSILKEAQAIQESRTEVDERSSRVTAWLDEEEEDEFGEMCKKDKVCLAQIWELCFRGELHRFTYRESRQLGEIMRRMPGWKAVNVLRFGKHYGRAKGFIRTT